VDAEQALAELMEISSQVDAAVLVDAAGEPLASTLPDERAARLARAGVTLLEGAVRSADGREVTQVEAATRDGSLFVVRDGDRAIVAATGATPTVGLVLYDLRTCLRGLEPPKPKRRRRKETTDAGA
jgi:predicted regulator of Ras-like GTPase activity (Roadblock/LC7/MglB family)